MRDKIFICENVPFKSEALEEEKNNSYEIYDNNDIAVLNINRYNNEPEENTIFHLFLEMQLV